MRVLISSIAVKRLARMQPSLRRRIETAIEKLASDPFSRSIDAKKPVGVGDGYRLRIGDWRVLYRIDRRQGTISVESVETRGGVYK